MDYIDNDQRMETPMEALLNVLQEFPTILLYTRYAKQKRDMIPWTVPWPIIQDPVEGEWTFKRIIAGFFLLNDIKAAKKLVESAAVQYLNTKGYIPVPVNPEELRDCPNADEDPATWLPKCVCKFLPLADYFPEDQKALDCLAKMKLACNDYALVRLRRCMETYEESFDCFVYICELVGNPETAQNVKDILNTIPARIHQLAREVSGRIPPVEQQQ